MTAATLSRPDAGLAGPIALSVSALSLAAVCFELTGAASRDINGFGLLAAYPPAAIAALGLGLATLVWSLCSRTVAPRWAMAQVAVLTVALAIGPILVEPFPRFATAWIHAGLAEYIARSGEVLLDTDARFSWPGFFAAAGVFAQAVGVEPLSLLRWTPLVLGLLYLLPLTVIVRTFVVDERQRVLALSIFVLGNWVGQDYFAPQGFNFLLYLTTMAVLLRLLVVDPHTTWVSRLLARLLRRSPDSADLAASAGSTSTRYAALAVVLLLYAASAVSHQLTQFFTLFAVAALVMAGVSRLGWLACLMAVITLAYFVWAAEDYWSGHLRDITADLGGLGSSIQSSVVSRTTTGTAPERAVVVNARLGLSAAVALLAAVGLVRRRDRILLAPALLAAAPVLVMALQSYGGEAALRVYLFALPWLAVLGAHALTPPVVDARPRAAYLAAVLLPLGCLGLATAFMLARFGNETFEQMRPMDVAATQAAYDLMETGDALFVLTESVPWRARDIERFSYVYATPPPLSRADLPTLLEAMRRAPRDAYLLLTEGQWSQLRFLQGVPTADLRAAREMYETTPELRRVQGSGAVGVFVLAGDGP
ncbi:MAG: hypothetical protein JWN77_3129 [Frankiales bacterium]|jgi:hypothetical protein|nr:hypothetical protein [Frankiales bacterium]